MGRRLGALIALVIATGSLAAAAPPAGATSPGLVLAYSRSDGVFVENVDGTGLHQVAPPSEDFAVSPDGSEIAVVTKQGIDVRKIDGTLERTLAGPLTGLTWTGLGLRGTGSGGVVNAIDPVTGALTSLGVKGGGLSPDLSLRAGVSGDGALVVTDVRTGAQQLRARLGLFDSFSDQSADADATWSPDGTRIVVRWYECCDDLGHPLGGAEMYDLRTGRSHYVDYGYCDDMIELTGSLGWSSDGQHLAIVCRSGTGNPATVNLVTIGGKARTLTSPSPPDPDYSNTFDPMVALGGGPAPQSFAPAAPLGKVTVTSPGPGLLRVRTALPVADGAGVVVTDGHGHLLGRTFTGELTIRGLRPAHAYDLRLSARSWDGSAAALRSVRARTTNTVPSVATIREPFGVRHGTQASVTVLVRRADDHRPLAGRPVLLHVSPDVQPPKPYVLQGTTDRHGEAHFSVAVTTQMYVFGVVPRSGRFGAASTPSRGISDQAFLTLLSRQRVGGKERIVVRAHYAYGYDEVTVGELDRRNILKGELAQQSDGHKGNDFTFLVPLPKQGVVRYVLYVESQQDVYGPEPIGFPLNLTLP